MPENQLKTPVTEPAKAPAVSTSFQRKFPLGKVIVGIIVVLLIIGCAVLGYLYFTQFKMNQKISEEKNALLEQIQAPTPTPAPTPSASPSADLSSQIEVYKAKIAKARIYNEFFTYYNSVIETHSGFTGWTEAEYQAGLRIAEKTNDTNFLNLLDAAWHGTSDPTSRIIAVQKAIAGGIENSLK